MPSTPPPVDAETTSHLPWTHVAAAVVDELLEELRLCSQTYLNALAAAFAREDGRRGFYEELARQHASEQHLLFGEEDPGGSDRVPRSPIRTATHAWIAARGVLPASDTQVVRRLTSLARDLAIRSEELLLYDVPRPIARRLVAFAAAARTSGERLEHGS
jgi:hypothetical protein